MYTTSLLSAAEKTAAEKTDLRWFDMSTNIVSCHVSAQDGKLESKPRGFRTGSSSAADPATLNFMFMYVFIFKIIL
jgi:hypothetical protein